MGNRNRKRLARAREYIKQSKVTTAERDNTSEDPPSSTESPQPGVSGLKKTESESPSTPQAGVSGLKTVVRRPSPSDGPQYRVVNVQYMFKQLATLFDHPKTCPNGEYVMKEEQRTGLVSTVIYECAKCGSTRPIRTETEAGEKELNNPALFDNTSMGREKSKQFLSLMGLTSE